MTKIILSGCCGKMGRTVTNIISTRDDCQIVAGVDIVEDSTLGYPVFQTFSEVQVKADVIIDFSNPALLMSMLDYAKSTNTAVVISTTGISDEQIKVVEEILNEQLHKPVVVKSDDDEGFKFNPKWFAACVSNDFKSEDMAKSNFMKKIIKDTGLKPQEILMVGDSEDHDIAPAAKLKMQTFHVKDIHDTEEIFEKLIKLKEAK